MTTKKHPPRMTTKKSTLLRSIVRDDERQYWLVAAAAAASHAADPQLGGEDWADMSAIAEAARFYAYRASQGDEAVELLRKACRAEGHAGTGEYFKKPPGFRGWSRFAAECFHEIGVDLGALDELVVGSKYDWSVYHLTICRTEGDPLFCPRGEERPDPGMLASVAAYGGVFDALKVVVRKRELVVSDGRQRVNTVLELNMRELLRYYGALEKAIRIHEPQARLLDEPLRVDDIERPRIIRGVPVVVFPLAKGRTLKAVSNAVRKHESTLDQVRATWDLAAELKESGTPEANIVSTIAAMRGCVITTVYNFLSLKKLSTAWMKHIEEKTMAVATGYRLAKETEARQREALKAWKAAKEKSYLLKLDPWVLAWLEGRELTAAPVVSPRDKAEHWDRGQRMLAVLRAEEDSPVAKEALQLLAALQPGREGDEAQDALPPRWRVALSGRTWEAPYAAQWQTIGVVDPQTFEDLVEQFSDVHFDADGLSVEDEEKKWIAHVLVRASRIWPGLTGDVITSTPTVGWAYDNRKITLGEALKLMEAPGETPTVGGGAALLPAAPAGQPARWPGFRSNVQKAWEASGVRLPENAARLGEAGLTPDFMGGTFQEEREAARPQLGDCVDTMSLGELYEAGAVSLVRLEVLYYGPHMAPPDPTVTLKGPRWRGFTEYEQAAYESAGVCLIGHAGALRSAGIKPTAVAQRVTQGLPEGVVSDLGAAAYEKTLGELYDKGRLTLKQVKAILAAGQAEGAAGAAA